MCNMPPKKIFKNKMVEFYQKRGPRGKKMIISKKKSELKRASKIEYKTCATCPQIKFS